jgi:hypothetical protein
MAEVPAWVLITIGIAAAIAEIAALATKKTGDTISERLRVVLGIRPRRWWQPLGIIRPGWHGGLVRGAPARHRLNTKAMAGSGKIPDPPSPDIALLLAVPTPPTTATDQAGSARAAAARERERLGLLAAVPAAERFGGLSAAFAAATVSAGVHRPAAARIGERVGVFAAHPITRRERSVSSAGHGGHQPSSPVCLMR